MYSKEQVHILVSQKEAVLHLDATGTIVRKTSKNEKRVYYYAAVLQLPSHKLCPILEMISSQHDSATIAAWLLKFKSYVLSTKKKLPIFSKIVIDFSFALLNAVVVGWNEMELKGYINLHTTSDKTCLLERPRHIK